MGGRALEAKIELALEKCLHPKKNFMESGDGCPAVSTW